ncbi:unnamed protein product [Lactuca saligna]|uniref:Uncharacterized protein n=1 Tax=Lactuca saligna TaxID=75948 RepID=A0AA36E4M1_LACSI|nr:unnamed protein product [Lactuca saligna]
MKTIDPKVEIGKLLTKEGAGPSKKSTTSNKNETINPELIIKETNTSKSLKTKVDEVVSKAVLKPIEPVVTEPTSVIIPSKTGVFRKLKLKYVGSLTSNVVLKTRLTHQGVLMREVLAPVSPHSKKRRVEDMAKKISKKKKTKKRQLVIPTDSSEEEQVPESPEPNLLYSLLLLRRLLSYHPKFRLPNHLMRSYELHTSLQMYLIQVPLFLYLHSSSLLLPPLIHQPSKTSLISPLHPSFHLNPPNPNDDSDNEKGGFSDTFEDLAFDEEKEDSPNHMLMSMKQFEILNKKLNSIIQSQADMGGGSLTSTFEIDALMKAFEARMMIRVSGMIRDSESRILEKIDQADQTTKLRINSFDSKYVGAVKELTNIQNERHTLFVMDVKKVREDVNQKLQELRDGMVREVAIV